MTTEIRRIDVNGIPVEVVRKKIKNIHLAVYPPDGRVRIAVPAHIDDDAARLAVVERLSWVQRRQRAVIEQARETEREMVSGESHYVGGSRYRLEVVEMDEPPEVAIRGNKTLFLQVRPGTDRAGRKAILDRWYRQRLRERIPKLTAKWAPKLGVEVVEWGIKRMRTRWGSCSISARRIWINLELAKKSDRCLEYIVVHEMVHLLEPTHSDRFRALMTRHLPSWEARRDQLNHSPLGFNDWTY